MKPHACMYETLLCHLREILTSGLFVRAFTEFTNTVVAMETAKLILDILHNETMAFSLVVFRYDVIKNMIMQIMINLFQILIWSVRNLSPYQI